MALRSFGLVVIGVMMVSTIGGFDESIISEELGLTEQGLVPSVLLTLGYRSDADFNAKLPKSRLSKEDIFTQL